MSLFSFFNCCKKSLNSQLIDATEEGDEKEVARLLKQGADSNAINTNGTSVLHLAVLHHNVKIVNILLEAKADVNIRGPSSSTWCCDGCSWKFSNVTPLHYSVYSFDYIKGLDLFKTLIAAGADINALCIFEGVEQTPLSMLYRYKSKRKSSEEVERILLSQGALLGTTKEWIGPNSNTHGTYQMAMVSMVRR